MNKGNQVYNINQIKHIKKNKEKNGSSTLKWVLYYTKKNIKSLLNKRLFNESF